MKKTLLLLCAVALLSSCSLFKKTTFTINNTTGVDIYSVQVFEFDDAGTSIRDFSIGDLPNNVRTDVIEAESDTDKIKVGFKVTPGGPYLYTVSYTKLTLLDNTALVLTATTMVQGTL